MTNRDNPQYMDDSIDKVFKKAMDDRDYDSVLNCLCDAADFFDAAGPTSAALRENYSIGTAITLMTDATRILTGEIGTVVRLSRFCEDENAVLARRKSWQRWADALERLDMHFDVGIQPLPALMRKHYVYAGARTPEATDRVMELWRASKHFMFKYYGWSTSVEVQPDWNFFRWASASAQLAGLEVVMEYLFGLQENWTATASRVYRQHVRYLDNNLSFFSPPLGVVEDEYEVEELPDIVSDFDDDVEYEYDDSATPFDQERERYREFAELNGTYKAAAELSKRVALLVRDSEDPKIHAIADKKARAEAAVKSLTNQIVELADPESAGDTGPRPTGTQTQSNGMSQGAERGVNR